MSANKETVWKGRKLSHKLHTMRYLSEPKSMRKGSKKFSDLINNEFNLNLDDFGFSLKSAISALIDHHIMQGKSQLQNKIDYYITPYNKDVNLKESMSFSDKLQNWSNFNDVAKKDWKLISNFILNNDK